MVTYLLNYEMIEAIKYWMSGLIESVWSGFAISNTSRQMNYNIR